MIALSIAARPRGISCREAKRVAIDDLKWDFERGYVVFPGNESRLPGHIFDAVELARDLVVTRDAARARPGAGSRDPGP